MRGASVLVIELQGALFFGTAERLAQIVDSETAEGTTAVLLELRRITEIDSTGARILGDIDAALAARGVKLALVLSGRTETAARLADIFQHDRFFPTSIARSNGPRTTCCERPEPRRLPELPLDRVPLLRDFTPDQIERLRGVAGAGGVAGRTCRLSARRSRLVALSRHPGPRQRPSCCTMTATSGS